MTSTTPPGTSASSSTSAKSAPNVATCSTLEVDLKPCGGRTRWKNQPRHSENEGVWETNIENEVGDDEDGTEVDSIFKTAPEQDNYEAYSQTIIDGDREAYRKSHLSIEKCGQDRYYTKERMAYSSPYSLTDFTTPSLLSDHATYINSDEVIDRPKSSIVISDTRFGKTARARSITPDHGYLNT